MIEDAGKAPLYIRAHSFLGKVWQLTRPYWQSEERGLAWTLLLAIIGLTLFMVFIDVQLNLWQREFFDALQNKNFDDFKRLMLRFCLLAATFIVTVVYKQYLQQMLEMRWRTWLTQRYVGDWLGHQTYYRLELERRDTDNPDQRISEDVKLFTNQTLGLSLGWFSSLITLVSFVGILWSISGAFSFALGGYEFTIPGYMVWAALLYAIVGSFITHFVGRRLIPLNFQQERFEADFRFNLVRLRENAEGVALYRGEEQESRGLLTRFERIRANWWLLMKANKQLNFMTSGYGQIAIIFPYVVAAPRFFSGAITLGQLTQIAQAFDRVRASLSWFVDTYSALASWKASVDRLLLFSASLRTAGQAQIDGQHARVEPTARDELAVSELDIRLPNGKLILNHSAFSVAPGDRVLLHGPSGSGKSTLFRAISGIWPFASGKIEVPRNARVLFLPQKPYIPIGSLRDAIAYPDGADRFSDEQLRETLRSVKLEHFIDRMAETQNWSMTMSPGEQQRLAIGRALLHKPDWLFLDEATASLDEPVEAYLYDLIKQRLPKAAIVSIAHRPQVREYHDQSWTLNNGKLVHEALKV